MQSTGQTPTISRAMIRKLVGVTAGSVVLSLLLTGLIMVLLGAGPDGTKLALAIAGFCPLVVTPPATFVFYRQTLELETAHQALHEAHRNLFAVHAELKAAHQRLEHRASHDGMTGLANRETFHERLSEIKRGAGRGYLLMIDADRFKQINDEFGHDAGDRALLAIADAISGSIRPTDFAARIGGEEFAIVLRDVGQEEALRIAERVRANVEETSVTTAEGTPFRVTVSIGCAAFAANLPTKDIMRAADRVLYEAKGAGRNLVRLADTATRAA